MQAQQPVAVAREGRYSPEPQRLSPHDCDRVRHGNAVNVHSKPTGPATLPPKAVVGPVLNARPGGALTMRPLVYGYFRLRPTDAFDIGICLRLELTAYANQEGLTLADVFTDHGQYGNEQAGRAGFVVMVESLRHPSVDGLLIPSLGHFSRFPGVQNAMRALIELETGARVFVMNDLEGGCHDGPGGTPGSAGHDSSIRP
jgi:hypothetical protein